MMNFFVFVGTRLFFVNLIRISRGVGPKGLVVISGCVRDQRREKWMDGERYWRFLICVVGMVMVGGISGYHGLDHPCETQLSILLT